MKISPLAILVLFEFGVVFIALPVVYALDVLPFHEIIPLVLVLVYCAAVLIAGKGLSHIKFSIQANWKTILIRFIVVTGLIFLVLPFVLDLPIFADFGSNRKLMVMVLIYPVLSVFPQEIIYREFFFYRYEKVFKDPRVLLVLNVLVFSFAHIYFESWIVLFFTLFGGLIFAITFLKTRSLLVVCIEHSLYGLLILSTGLSEYFYKAF